MTEGVSNKAPAKSVAGEPAKIQDRFGPSKEAALAGAEAPAYYTAKQIAERWQCSEKKVYRLIESKVLVAHRFGSQLRISAADRTAYERMNRG